MNIAIFGGAFNPVHNGHLHLARELLKFVGTIEPFDKLVIIPTANPPHKTNDGLISGEHRINMLKLAFEDFDNVEISTIEFESKEKSYTYNTLKKLKKIYPNDDFTLLIGSDQLFYFKKWYKYDRILKLADVVAITREECERQAVADFLNDDELKGRVHALVSKPVVVSSTEIRERVRTGQDISSLVPKLVENYIKENKLYV